jgi:hypothetical protein
MLIVALTAAVAAVHGTRRTPGVRVFMEMVIFVTAVSIFMKIVTRVNIYVRPRVRIVVVWPRIDRL